MTEFAMVEELASLVKDNLSCKHLVLSTEEALVNFLQNDTSQDGVIEFEPMTPYHRLLLHRLAEIFGFAHESVGEGDGRHLILERCLESSIPSILVSDILLQYDGYRPSTTSTLILRREEALPALKPQEASFPPSVPVVEREAAYLAARERIFSLNEDDRREHVAPKPRNVPVVARRMIAHALGQRINSNLDNQGLSFQNSEEGLTKELNIAEKNVVHTNPASQATRESKHLSGEKLGRGNSKVGRKKSSSSHHTERKVESKSVDSSSGNGIVLQSGGDRRNVGVENLEREHVVAAKRMFAHALGKTHRQHEV